MTMIAAVMCKMMRFDGQLIASQCVAAGSPCSVCTVTDCHHCRSFIHSGRSASMVVHVCDFAKPAYSIETAIEQPPRVLSVVGGRKVDPFVWRREQRIQFVPEVVLGN